MVRSVVAGLGNKDYRQALEGLLSKGWSVKKTNGNHLRLEHPEARHPVFASSTPNLSPRSIKNMEAECRRALRPAPVEAPVVRKHVEETQMPRRKTRKPRHSEMVLFGQVEDMKPASAGFDLPGKKSAISATALGAAVPLHLSREDGPPPAFEAAPRTAKAAQAEPAAKVDRTFATTETETKTATEPAAEAAEEDKSMIAVTADCPAATSTPATGENHPAFVAEMPSIASAPVSAEPVHAEASLLEILMQIQRGEHDKLMGLAGRIHRGELKPITVTADMVGATIWVSCDAVVAGGGKAAASAAPDVAKAPMSKVLTPASMKRFQAVEPFLSDEWQLLSDMLQAANLTDLGEGERQCYRAAFRRAADAGLVDRLDEGKVKLYRKLA